MMKNNQNNQLKSIDWFKWYKQKQIKQMNEKKWMNKMIWRLMNSNKLISVFISLFHFYHLLKNAELRIDKSKGKVYFIHKKFGQNWSKITMFFLCFNKKFLKSLNLVNAKDWFLMFYKTRFLLFFWNLCFSQKNFCWTFVEFAPKKTRVGFLFSSALTKRTKQKVLWKVLPKIWYYVS